MRRPAVLVVRTGTAEQLTVVLLHGDRRKGYTLGDGVEPVHARVPLRRSGNSEVTRFQADFRYAAQADWEAWAEPVTGPAVGGDPAGDRGR